MVLDPGGPTIADGTRVEVRPRTGMEPMIRKRAGVYGGNACIGMRRIPVWQLVESRPIGFTDDQLLHYHAPPLTREELDAAWRYAAANPEEVAEAIRANNEDE